MGEPCYSIVRKPKGFEVANEMTLKRRIEGVDLDKCLSAIEELLQSVLDGEKFPTNLMMSVINRYQMMNQLRGADGPNKRIKKLLYILWECLPKKGPDGKFMHKLLMVCGAFDSDLKHPNQYVCGSALRTISKTRELEFIQMLVHSIEKCLEWSHAYQRKNAVLAIARVFKNFPDLIPQASQKISEHLIKENDDEVKRAALQALLEIAPEQAKSYLHSSNIPDIHCMNASIQLLFVELIQKIFKKGSDDSETHLTILSDLIKSSSSPSVRYQAAVTLIKFTRDPEALKMAAGCFIDICAKDSDNNVKLVALDSLMDLRRINGAERVLRSSIMDILCILQSATDLEMHQKILKLSLDLISPINVSGVVSALRHELKKLQDSNVLGSQQETTKYRRLLVETSQVLADRFPNAIVEGEMFDTMFDLLVCSSIEEKTSLRLIKLFKLFMANNPAHRASVIKKIQDNFNLAKNNSFVHGGLIHLLGDFSETKTQIEESCRVIKESIGELPIVETEMQKLQKTTEGTGDEVKKTGGSSGDGVDGVTKSMSRLVTADGSYATQSAINYQSTASANSDHPPLRSYYLRNKFDTASVLYFALLKMAARYQQVDATQAEKDKLIATSILILVSILNLGYSSLTDSEGNLIRINNYHAGNLMLGLNILLQYGENGRDANLLNLQQIVTEEMRAHLGSAMKYLTQDRLEDLNPKKQKKNVKFDDRIRLPFSKRDDDSAFESEDENETEETKQSGSDMFGETPLTGNIDPIYAYCIIEGNDYDITLKIHLENRTQSKTFENVCLELALMGENSSLHMDRPEPIVLAPRATACIQTPIKIVSAQSRNLFGSISFDDVSSDDREKVIMLNDITFDMTEYIKPASISFEDFRDIWRDCEWENKVSVKTRLTNLKEYLTNLINHTNMRCISNERSLAGECSVLSANLYAKSMFGEEALVNVSIEKESPTSVVKGSVKIRSRSQGMAISLGEKITAAQTAASTASS